MGRGGGDVNVSRSKLELGLLLLVVAHGVGWLEREWREKDINQKIIILEGNHYRLQSPPEPSRAGQKGLGYFLNFQFPFIRDRLLCVAGRGLDQCW